MAKQFEFDAIGTRWSIEANINARLQHHILHRINAYDTTYSRFRPDSLVARIAKQSGDFLFPLDAEVLLAQYELMYTATQGLVTPLIGQTLADAGYDADYSLRPAGVLSAPPPWEDCMQFSDSVLTTSMPVLLDFGAAGKGHLVDIVSDMIPGESIVDAGGDMRVTGTRKIGLEHPDDGSLIIGVAEITNQSLCGSAINRRAWSTYNHVINPRTLKSPTSIRAVWVIAKTALLADGIATCLFFAQPSDLQQTFNFEYVIMFNDNSAEISHNFPGQLF